MAKRLIQMKPRKQLCLVARMSLMILVKIILAASGNGVRSNEFIFCCCIILSGQTWQPRQENIDS